VDTLFASLKARKRAGASRAARMLCALVLVLPGLAWATRVDNTAHVTYRTLEGVPPVTLNTNTVSFEIIPSPVPATLSFLRYDPDSSDGSPIAIDGGQCRVDGGSFTPLPDVTASDGTPLDQTQAQTSSAPGYYTGDPIVVAVTDSNRNADPAVREYVDVDITTTTGDAETLRLQETGPDTGMFAGAIQSVAMPPAATQYDCVLSLAAYAQITARYTDTDFPLDALAVAATGYAPLEPGRTVIHLEQTVSKDIVSIGDFLQYTLVVSNIHDAPAINARIRDLLPPGLRFRPGSLRVGNATTAGDSGATPTAPSSGAPSAAGRTAVRVGAGMVAAVDPQVSADGRTLRFPVGNLAPGASITATFVAEVGAGASGQYLLNYAIASANGSLSSNETDTVVRMEDALATGRFTIIGRVLAADSCDAPFAARKGVPNVRLLLEDGTYAATDRDGAYHIEGVRPGTHVLQLDPASIPADLEAVPCVRNTRFAGRADSQFVEAQGGTLWRGDFFLRKRPPVTGAVGVRLQLAPIADGMRNTVDVDGGAVRVAGLRVLAILPPGATVVAGSAKADGAPIPDPEVKGNFAIFRLGDPGVNWRRQVVFDIKAGNCSPEGYVGRVSALFDTAGAPGRTPAAEATARCTGSGPGDAVAAGQRVETILTAAAAEQAASARPDGAKTEAIVDDATAAGGGIDWLRGQAPGHDWLFPAEGYNPRAAATRVVVKHAKGEKVALRVDGEAVESIRFDGQSVGANGVAISTWRSIHLVEGDNRLEATITDASGNVVAQLSRTVHLSGDAARAVFVPERSALAADGIHRPVIAVRILDGSGKPMRNGSSGDFTIAPPYAAAQSLQDAQARSTLGMEARRQQWHVRGDDGIALIELEPTGSAGTAKLGFDFKMDGQKASVHEDVAAWLKAAPRDWVVVGFAKGSVGYDTLEHNMEALPPGEDGTGVQADGRAALYAKGRVLGSWLLTMAYDSGKDTSQLRDRSVLSTIDPGQYYTLYGDGMDQRYDAASSRKLYLKLERDQFYALFGDFESGLDRTQLSRYQRTLTGLKVEYHGPLVEFNGFAAETGQNYARDELQGDGTSGLYRLRRTGIVINSERIRIETRDRYHSEQVLETRELTRHIDYDIDYDNGTLFFREPVASRDYDFNPNWIVAEYETTGTGEQSLNGGGRVAVHAMDGRLEAGATYVRDDNGDSRTDLAGLDAKFRLTPKDELRAEAAATRGDATGEGEDGTGTAWLLEWEHRGERSNLLAYARRMAPGFGLGQQNQFEAAMFKAGVQGQYQLDRKFSLQGEAYRQENLDSGAVRDVAHAEAVYRGESDWTAKAGLQWARDTSIDGAVAESQQATAGVTKGFLDGKLELGVQAEVGMGGKNDSVDFPTRVQLSAAYRLTEAFRVLAAQEFTDGADRDTSTTRFGFEATPWKDAKLTSTLNRSQISEYGPRTFAQFGLDQKVRINERWSVDGSIDSSQAFHQGGDAPLVVDPSQPIQAGGIRDGGALTENFVAVSGGVTYRSPLWLWNARTEARQSDSSERYGFTTGFLRQVTNGVAFSASAQAFSQSNAGGGTGILASAQASLAYRPLGREWSMLDKLEFRLDEVKSGSGDAIIGQNTLAVNGDARSARFINNFVLNYASDAWRSAEGGDGQGSVLDLYQRSQLSFYYGSKYVLDTYDGDDYSGYTDILGAEVRYDLTSRIDVGLRASVLHSWSQHTYAWAFGPSIGFTPFTNAWVSVGYNIRGFNDRDFESSHYTAEGAYLVFRMKFDQRSLGLDGAGATR
jgi:uncharacterized repeat protein (TIGR01451 family)